MSELLQPLSYEPAGYLGVIEEDGLPVPPVERGRVAVSA